MLDDGLQTHSHTHIAGNFQFAHHKSVLGFNCPVSNAAKSASAIVIVQDASLFSLETVFGDANRINENYAISAAVEFQSRVQPTVITNFRTYRFCASLQIHVCSFILK
jgi:hypothetical protein